MISKEQLDKFKLIYKKEFNKEISDQEALEQATKLLNLMEIVYKSFLENEVELKNYK
ncbi:hypothetical protein M0Q39_05670 [Patescibacteria group bacterium]|nr:hypothetical protein [Patescibacteria group bacterium]